MIDGKRGREVRTAELPVYVPPVLLAVDGHTPHSHLSAGSEHSDSDLSPVGHQDLLDGLDTAPSRVRGEVGGGGGQMDTWDWPPFQPSQGLHHLRDHLARSVWLSMSLDFPTLGFSLNWSAFSGCICPLQYISDRTSYM